MPSRKPAGRLYLTTLWKNGIRTAPVLAAIMALLWASIAVAATSETKAPPLVAPAAPVRQGGCTVRGDLKWIDPTDGTAAIAYFLPDKHGIATVIGALDVNGTTRYGFCLDSEEPRPDSPYCFDAATTDWRITYLLTKYPPRTDNRLLQAAHQAAMWHYTNGLQLDLNNPVNEGEDANAVVRNEYNKILADIDSFGNTPPPVFNAGPLVVTATPSNQNVGVGGSATVTVHLEKGGAGLAGYTIHAATSLGSVDAASRNTDSNGNAVFTVTSNQAGTANLVISADVDIPGGQRFVAEANPDTDQPLGVSNSTREQPGASASVTFDAATATPTLTPSVTPTPRPRPSSPQNIPEPLTIVLFGSGLAALSAAVAKRKNKK